MIALEELILTWRKAKVDLYYSTNPSLFARSAIQARTGWI